MARGSSGGSGGGGGETSTNKVEMPQQQANLTSSGKYTLRKSFFVQQEQDLKIVEDVPNMRPTNVSWTRMGPGWQQVVDYEANVTSGESKVVETLQGREGRFELDTQDELVPMLGHPNIQDLIKKFQGKQNGNILWFPATYDDNGQTKTNPMAGRLYYTKPAATFRHIIQLKNIPTDIWTDVGKKVERLPAGFPNPPNYTNLKGELIKYYWIVLSPQIYRRGDSYEIVRTYKLSEWGAPNELYDRGTNPA